VLSFSEIRVSGGTITVSSHARRAEQLSDGNCHRWPSISRSFGASGRFVWREEA
jgi:hypothetical protein